MENIPNGRRKFLKKGATLGVLVPLAVFDDFLKVLISFLKIKKIYLINL
jgi:hypothetical protein